MTAADEHETHDGDASTSLHAEAVHDPPPPYPTPRRSRRSRRVHAANSHHQQVSSGAEADETTPFLMPPSTHPQHHHRPSDGEQRHTRTRSDSSGSMWSTISGSPSLAQTVFTFFDDVDVDSEDEEECGEPHLRRRDHFPVANAAAERVDGRALVDGQTGPHRPDWKTKIRRYFRPLRKKVYYMSLVHLLLVNFPMALIAWVSLFVLTLLGTTLLMVLPLGLLLCFIDLLFARLLSRFELHLQTKFHFPAASLRRKPPIFVRPRAQPADEETPLVQPHSNTPNLTSPHLPPVHNVLLDETSFYKNTYAMFSDPTSYHALFYFLVIKPPITLLFSLFLVVIIVPLLVVIVTAPAALRLVRRMGVWQAAVAVEGLAGEA